MEFIVIEYPERRRARMDALPLGFTQAVLNCRAGLHSFDLGSPRDYTPVTQSVRVAGTNALKPMRIRFHKREGAFIDMSEIAPAAADAVALSAAARSRPASEAARARTTKKGARRRAAKTKRSTRQK
jgi:hypothetical protein